MHGTLMKKALIIGLTSDIGRGIESNLLADGWEVYGTSTNYNLGNIIKLDLADSTQLNSFSRHATQYDNWSLLFFIAGTMEPIGPFFETNLDDWENSLRINVLSQIKILQILWPYRSKYVEPNVCFLAGGGTNSSFDNYSSYCLSKIMLIKFVELMASENSDSKFFIIGPGFMKTKIHNQTLKANTRAGRNLEKTALFMEGNGTSISRLYKHIMWCINQPKDAISGRNFSTVHDPWDSDPNLPGYLLKNSDLYKLRRRDFGIEEV